MSILQTQPYQICGSIQVLYISDESSQLDSPRPIQQLSIKAYYSSMF